jgi:hypothetical protein
MRLHYLATTPPLLRRLVLSLLCALALQLAPIGNDALAEDQAERLLNILKKRPRGKALETWLEERREAARELGRLKEKRAVPHLLKIIEKERFDVILEIAIDALGEIGDKRAVAPLKKLLNDPSLDAYVRDAVAGALRKLGEEGPKPPEGGGGTKPPKGGGTKPPKIEEPEPPGPETRETTDQDNLALRLAKLQQPFGGLAPLELKLPADLLARMEKWEILGGAADVRWDKRASLVSGSLSLASHAFYQVERRAVGYSIDGQLDLGFRVTNTPAAPSAWDFNHSLNIYPEVRWYPAQHDAPLFCLQLSGGVGYGLDFGATGTMDDRRLAFASTISVGGGPAYGRMFDVGAKLRLRRLQIVMKKAGLLSGHIDRAVGDQLITAWYQLRNRVGSFWQLGYTLDILNRAGLLSAKEGIDPATLYRVIRILDDPQLLNRREGMMFRLGYGYARNFVRNGSDADLGFVYLTGEHAWQIGTTRALESSLRFYYEHITDPHLYGLTGKAGFVQYLYNPSYDPLGALSAFVSVGFNNQPGPTSSTNTPNGWSGLGYQVMAGGSYARIFNRGTEISLAAQLGVQSGAPLFLVSLAAKYGVVYGAISPSE